MKKAVRARTLEDIETPFGRIEVVRLTSGAVLYRQAQVHQTETDGHGVSLSMYIHALFGLLIQAWSRNVLLIGGGGGALATMMSSTGARVSVVDINPQAFRIARQHFGMPDSIAAHVADGADYLAAPGRKFDAIVFDAYHDADVPPHMIHRDVLKLAAARLTKAGLFLANVYLRDDADDRGRLLAERAAEIWPHVRMLDEPDAKLRNCIVMAGRVKDLRPPELTLSPRIDAGAIKDELRRLRFIDWPGGERPAS